MTDSPFQIVTFNVDSSAWTPVVSPIACDNVGIKNSSGDVLLISTDTEDDGAQDEIPIGGQELIVSGRRAAVHWNNPGMERAFRFEVGDVVCWLQSKTGSNVAKVRFLW